MLHLIAGPRGPRSAFTTLPAIAQWNIHASFYLKNHTIYRFVVVTTEGDLEEITLNDMALGSLDLSTISMASMTSMARAEPIIGN